MTTTSSIFYKDIVFGTEPEAAKHFGVTVKTIRRHLQKYGNLNNIKIPSNARSGAITVRGTTYKSIDEACCALHVGRYAI